MFIIYFKQIAEFQNIFTKNILIISVTLLILSQILQVNKLKIPYYVN